MADMAKWGPKTWTVSPSQVKALQDLSVAYTQIADDNSGTEDNSLSNNRGMDLIEISFKTVINANAGVNVRSEISSWRKLVTATEYLYINGTKFGPLLQLREVKVTELKLDDKGRFREATLTFQFKEYNKESTSYLGVSALKVGNGNASRMGKRNKKVSASSSSSSTTTIKKGSKVKIKGSKYSNGKKIPKKAKKKTYTVSKVSKGIATLKGLKYKVRVKDLSLVATKKKKTSKKKSKKKTKKKKGKKK